MKFKRLKKGDNMSMVKDLTNQTFGALTVIHRSDDHIEPSGRHKVTWLCQCQCGNMTTVLSSHLLSGHTKSCGCLTKKIIGEKNLKNIIGNKYGKLTVIKRVDDHIQSNGKHRPSYLCKCDCGNECITTASNLQSGRTKSCGCLLKEINYINNFDDLTNKKFGKLLVLQRAEDYLLPNTGKRYVRWLCQCDCGNICVKTAASLRSLHTQSCGCIKSSGEYNVGNFLSNNQIEYQSQKKFDNLYGIGGGKLSYDFWLSKYNLLIECQGKQHYQPITIYGGDDALKIQQEHDRRKREYAETNGYKLLEISYWNYDKIDEILSKELSVQ